MRPLDAQLQQLLAGIGQHLPRVLHPHPELGSGVGDPRCCTMPLQQFVYRQLMYLVVIQSLFTALAGLPLR